MSSSESSEPDLLEARAALVALRGSAVRRGAGTTGYTLVLPDLAPLSRAQAAARLAGLPKPVACAGFMAHGCLVVAAWSVGTDPDRCRVHAESTRKEIAWLRDTYSRADRPTKIRVEGAGEEVVLTLDELERWCYNYDLLLTNSVTNAVDESPASDVAARIIYLPDESAGSKD